MSPCVTSAVPLIHRTFLSLQKVPWGSLSHHLSRPPGETAATGLPSGRSGPAPALTLAAVCAPLAYLGLWMGSWARPVWGRVVEWSRSAPSCGCLSSFHLGSARDGSAGSWALCPARAPERPPSSVPCPGHASVPAAPHAAATGYCQTFCVLAA